MSYTPTQEDFDFVDKPKSNKSINDEYIPTKEDFDFVDRIQKPKKTGWEAVKEDISNSFSGVPQALWETIKSAPSEIGGAGKQLFTQPGRALQNLGGGVAGLGHGILSGAGNVRDYLASRGLVSEQSPSFRLPESVLPREYNYPEALGREGNQAGDALLESAPAAAAFGTLGELGAASRGFGGALGKGLKRGGAASLYGIAENQDPLQTAILQGALGKLAKTLHQAPGAIRGLTPSRMLRGNLSPEELQRNLNATAGTNTPLGDVIQSPGLKKFFENTTAEVPFSGGGKLLNEIKGQVEGRADQTMKNLAPEKHIDDVNEHVKRSLVSAFKKQRTAKNQFYEPVSKIAEETGHKLELPTFHKLASDTAESIENSPLMKNDPDFRKMYSKLRGLESATSAETSDILSPILDAQGNPIVSGNARVTRNPTIQEANQVKNTLYDEGKKLLNSSSSNDRSLGDLLKKLSGNIYRDVESSIEKEGSPELKKSYSVAKKNYKENYSPFLDKEAYKFLNPDKSGEAIVHEIVRPGKKDLHTRIKKIQNLLPGDEKNLLGHAYLQQAVTKEHGLEPKKLAQLIKGLGPRQMKALFPNEVTRQQVLDYSKLRGLNEEALSAMANPKTGARGIKHGLSFLQGGAGATALAHGNPVLAVASVVAPIIGARQANKIITSEAYREKLVARMKKIPVEKQTKDDKYALRLAKAMTGTHLQEEKRKPLELTLTKARGK